MHCGACCFSSSKAYARVTGSDWSRLGPAAEHWAHFQGNRAFLRMENGHCRALSLRQAETGATEYFCQIYELRPDICRSLEQGSPSCEAERLRKLPQRPSA